jgi:ABC-type transport system involved in multi-copper enzyme maturation permease subunit
MTVVGPLFRYELTRLARRGLQPRLRAVFAGLLAAALLALYLQAFPGVSPAKVLLRLDVPMPVDKASKFGEYFLVTFLIIQLVVVVVVTPAVAGGSLAEEKERGSLDLLLVSPLSGWEIVFGKMLARLVFVGGVVLAGLPVLALTSFFGGVDPWQLLAGYAITFLTILSLGSFSLLLAMKMDGLRSVLIWSYGTVAAVSLLGLHPVFAPFSPFSTLLYLFLGGLFVPLGLLFGFGTIPWEVLVVAGYATVHVPLAALFLGLTAASVRTSIRRLPKRLRARPRYAFPRDDDLPPVLARPDRRVRFPDQAGVRETRERPVPRLAPNGDPLAWKERWFGGRLWPAKNTVLYWMCAVMGWMMAGLIVMTLMAATLFAANGQVTFGQVYGLTGRVVSVVVVPVFLLGLGVLVAGSLARERHKQTLDSLLTLPISRRLILQAKAWASVRTAWPLAAVIVGAVAVGVLTGGMVAAAVLTVQFLVLGWGGFAVGFGTWLSVRCRTPARATGYLIGTVLAACLVPPLVSPLFRDSMPNPLGPDAEVVEAAIDGLSPMVAGWNALAAPVDEGGLARLDFPVRAVIAAAGALAAGLVGGIFWGLAVRRFENEGC